MPGMDDDKTSTSSPESPEPLHPDAEVRTVSITEAKRGKTLEELVDWVEGTNRTVFITRRGRPAVALVAHERWVALEEQLLLYVAAHAAGASTPSDAPAPTEDPTP